MHSPPSTPSRLTRWRTPITWAGSSRVARLRVAGVALVTVGVIAACDRDMITAPRSDVTKGGGPQLATDPLPSLPPPEGSQVPYGVTATVGTPNADGSVTWQKLGDVPRPLVGQMRIKQRVTQNGPDRGLLVAGPQGVYVAGFYDNTCVLKAAMGYRYDNGGGWTEDWRPGGANCPSAALEESNPNLTWLGARAGIYGGRGSGSYELCGRGCHTYDGYTTYIFTPTSNVISVTASPATVVEGSEVTFTATRSNAALTSVAGWVWRSKDSAEVAQTVPCATTSTTCTTRVFEDGWMFAQVEIDGYLHTAYAGARVTLAKVVVTASDTAPPYGDSVTYTARPDPADVTEFAIKGWTFVPDDTTLEPTPLLCQDTTCTVVADVPGTMHVYATLARRTDSASVHVTPANKFELTADKLTVFAGETVTFTPILNDKVVPAGRWLWRPTVDDPTDVTTCADNTQPCQKVIVAAGTMWAYVTSRSGHVDSAYVEIDVAIVCSGSPGTLSSASSKSSKIAPSSSRARSTSVAASLSASTSSACQDGGDPSGTYKQLRVITYGGVAGKPLPADSVLVIAYRTGKTVNYQYSAAERHVDLAVVVDDTGRTESGALVMDQNRTIEVAADFDYANDPEVLALRERFRNLLRAGNKVEAYRQHLEWFANSSQTAVRDPDSLSVKLTVARNIEFDYGEYGALVLAFDDALRGHAFRLSPGAGPKTVTVWSAFDNEMAAASELTPQLSSSAAAAPTVPPAVIVFVNGVRTPLEDADEMVDAMADLATAEPGLAGVPSWLFWNRTADAQVDAYAQGLGCAGRYGWWDEIKKRLTNDVNYSRCRNRLFVRRLHEDDIAESMRQFLNVVARVPTKLPEDVPLLAQFTVDQHELGMHTIFTLHSQGNLMLSQALPLIPGIPQSRQAMSRCTAAVSLASPIGKNKFMADTGSYLRGITIGDLATANADFSTLAGDDLLLRVPNTNYGTHGFERRTSGVRDQGLARLAQSSLPPQMKTVKGWLLSLDVHFVGPNYFGDPFNSREIANFLVGLYDTCKSPPKKKD